MLKPKYGTVQSRKSLLGEVKMIDVKLPTPKFRAPDIEEEPRPHSALAVHRDWEDLSPPPTVPEPQSSQPPALLTPYLPPEETDQSSPDKMSVDAYLPPRCTIIPSKRSSEVPRNSIPDLNSSLAVAVLRPRSSLTAEPAVARLVGSERSLLLSRPVTCFSPVNISDLVNSVPSGKRPRSGIVRHGRLIKGKVALEGVRSSGRAVRCVHLID